MSWADDRTRLNHDVLANYVANELMALALMPYGDVSRLCQFTRRKDEFERLFAEGEECLSFARIIDCPLFDVWDAGFRCKMREAAHGLFLATSAVPAQIKDLKNVFGDCLAAVVRFLSTPSDLRTVEQVESLREWVERLQSGLSTLPKTPGG